MPDRVNAVKGLTEIVGYMLAKADIAGVGKGKEVFDRWYRAAEDACELLKEQEPDGDNCGECGYALHRINYDGPGKALRQEWFRFCPHCGRKAKWE